MSRNLLFEIGVEELPSGYVRPALDQMRELAGRALEELYLEHGSISAAARSMSMSYRHAWKLVDSINTQAADPLVEMSTGGAGGGGAKLTGAGKQAIDTFWAAHAEFKAFLEQRSAGLEW